MEKKLYSETYLFTNKEIDKDTYVELTITKNSYFEIRSNFDVKTIHFYKSIEKYENYLTLCRRATDFASDKINKA